MTETTAEMPRQDLRLVIGALMLVMLLSSLSQTIVSAALPTIVGELGGLDYLAWIVTAYILAMTVVTPIYGKLGDLIGRKVVLQTAIILFLVGSALCGLAQSTSQLILFRALQGLGGGGLMVSSMAAVGDVVSPRERGRYQGYFGAVFGVSTVVGPLLGGYIVEHTSWRWIFYVNLPIGVAALAVIAFAFAPRPRQDRPKVDYLGSVLLAISLTGLVLATSIGGHTVPWTSLPVLALAAVAAVSLVALMAVERRAEEPILPPELFAGRTFCIASAVCFIVGVAMFAAVTFMPVYLQVVQGASPANAGLALTPLMGGMLVTSVGSGRLISRHGRYRVFPIVGTALIAAGFLLMSRLGVDSPVWVAILDMLIVGLGIGLVMQVMVLAVQNAVDYRHLGVATSGVTLFRSIGAALGVAGAGALFSAGLASGLIPNLPAGSEIASDPAQILTLPEATRAIYRTAYAGALRPVFLVAACVAAAGFILALLLREVPLRETIADQPGAVDMADSFAMPRQASSLAELEYIIANAVSGANRREAMRRIIRRLDLDLSPEEAWVLLHVARAEAAEGAAPAIGRGQETRAEAAQRLIERGLIERAPDGTFTRTAKGREVFATTVAAYRARLSDLIARWAPEDHDEVRRMLTDFARQLVAEMPEPTQRE
ncbi:MDR family MFS transporter [Celeribacter indicus]|uniref:EmrB/QacA subfamily drug resistance transporter n=1 Tax=Celeribacter indicus TaxID=1208324 RepID=A0A0B5E022_9RHOB|nr:MDR family MFS transporter [Celeribacter indicus]AJE46730.1 EmrB/QacA subfamily drug resistance transporter [Celeribacter indicus]SDX05004.1 drug resistance transporter, EmrB/QacA subfamily [Celeribacter indicus]